jgi:hypothetical protein
MVVRLLARAAPLVLGALAAAIWLRRREPERLALTAGDQPVPAPALPAPQRQATRFVRRSEADRVDIVTVVDDLLGVPEPSGI